MVLSPYLAQCKLIKEKLKENKKNFGIDIKCQVCSVVTSQGGYIFVFHDLELSFFVRLYHLDAHRAITCLLVYDFKVNVDAAEYLTG